MGKLPGETVCEAAEHQSLELGFHRLRDRFPLLVTRSGYPEIVAYRETIEDARYLCLDADAQPRNFMCLERGNVDPAKRYRSVGRLDLACQEFEESALAGSIGADQTAQLSLCKREIDAPDRLYSAEMLDQSAGFDQRPAHALPSRATLRGEASGWRSEISQG